MHNQFTSYENIVPLLAPQDIAATDTPSGYLNIKNAQRVAFLVSLGAITSTSAADVITVTVESCTAENAGTEEAMPFNYRLSGALGDNTWGAVTTAASGGFEIAITDDNKLVWIEVDPSNVAAENDGAYMVRVLLTSAADAVAILVGVVGIIEPRYAQTTYISATASASA